MCASCVEQAPKQQCEITIAVPWSYFGKRGLVKMSVENTENVCARVNVFDIIFGFKSSDGSNVAKCWNAC